MADPAEEGGLAATRGTDHNQTIVPQGLLQRPVAGLLQQPLARRLAVFFQVLGCRENEYLDQSLAVGIR